MAMRAIAPSGKRPMPPKAAPPSRALPQRGGTVGGVRPAQGRPVRNDDAHLAAMVSEAPAWLGAASKKFKWTKAAERGIVAPLGHTMGNPVQRGAKPQTRGAIVDAQDDGMKQWNPRRAGGIAAAPALGAQKRGAAALEPAAADGPRPVDLLTLSAEAGLVVNGMPETGYCVTHTPDKSYIQSSSSEILTALGVEAESITINHDSDWNLYPEVAEAIKLASGEERNICVVEFPERQLWGVGAGGKWKQREQAARLALCIGIVAQSEEWEAVQASHPDFVEMCEEAGLNTGMAQKKPAKGKGNGKTGQPARTLSIPAAKSGQGVAAGGKGAAPKNNMPVWINMANTEEGIPEAIDSYPGEALVTMTQGTGRAGLYNKVDQALAHFLNDPEESVMFHDDPDWEDFPTIGQEYCRASGGSKQPMMLAFASEASAWSVGVATKEKDRRNAAKAALAATLALQAIDAGQELSYDDFPGLEDFVEEARAARA